MKINHAKYRNRVDLIIELRIQAKGLILKYPKYNLDELLAEIGPDNRHAEISTGLSIESEIL